MAKKLIRLYEQDTTDFSNNGLKILNPTSAKITRNLIEYTYQLELTHLLDEKGMMLTEERILGYNGQYFRISSIRRNLKEVSVIAKHIFFDLNKNFIEDINIKNKTGSMALAHILGGTSYPHSFSATSDIDTVASSRLVRKNVVSALIGDTDNSFINRWGGELDIDGFTFKLNEQIGKDDGYTIQYGKNLTGLDLQLNMLEVVTRIRPVGFDGIEIDGLYVDSPYIDNYALPIIKEIKYENVKWKGSPNYEEREDDDSYIYDNLAEAQAKLIELATNEFVVNEIDLPKTTINIEFIELSKTEEYKHLKFLQNINIGDTVHIYHKPLDINLKSRCIEYVYDCILNKYETITLGSYTKNFFTKTQNTNNTLDSGNLDVKFSGMVNDILQQTQKHLNDSITQAMGGYVYKTNNALYIMDTDDISTAQNIWTWNRNGLAFSSNGVNGPYTTGITMDGYIVGSMISANSITGEQIQANSIKTANLELSVQQKIQNATDEETVKALIKADLDGFESTLSKEFVTVENATTQIQQATEVAVKEATQSIIDNAVSESMGAVDGQLNDKLNQYTGNTLLPAIAEKAEEVLQNAEDYVVTKLENYATKQELSSSISQTREQIELSVSEKYTTKTESATFITEAIDGITVGAINRVLGTGENKSFKFNGGANETWLPYKFSNDISDKEVFVSFKYTLTGTAQNGSQIEFAPSYLKKANNQTVYRPKHIFFTSNRLQDVNITDTVSFTTKDFQDISPSSTSYIRFVGNGFTGTLSISEVQIKPGNSKTSWSPAPEDVNNDIVNAKNEAIISANNTLISTIANHYTKSETDSKISVAKDEINLGVSNKYETKANVETKVTSTLNSAKSYADTKKTEAINSAATDATSKVNAAKSELNTAIDKKANTVDVYKKTEVYTKNETNSQITTAKNEINQSVSSTYETKTNVTTKLNNLSVSATNLMDNSAPLSTSGWAGWSSVSGLSTSMEVSTTDNSTHGKQGKITFSGSVTGNAGRHKSPVQKLTSGKTYSWSIWLRSGSGNLTVDVGQEQNGRREVSVGTSWTRFTHTYTANDSQYYAFIIRPKNVTSSHSLYFHSVMLVEGDKPVAWQTSPTEVLSDKTSIEQRMNSAESKITDTAITNTVKKNFYTKEETNDQITNKGYQTATQVQQLVDSVQTKFSESGGYNKILNGGFNKSTEMWSENNSPGLRCPNPDKKYEGDSCLFMSTTVANSGVYQRFNCTVGKTYTYSLMVYIEAGTIKAGIENVKTTTAGHYASWVEISGTFTATSTNHTFIIYSTSATATRLYIDCVMVQEGSIKLPYSPHPSEVYDGIISQSREGITIEHSNSNLVTKYTNNGMVVNDTANNYDLLTANDRGVTVKGGRFTVTDPINGSTVLWGRDVVINGHRALVGTNASPESPLIANKLYVNYSGDFKNGVDISGALTNNGKAVVYEAEKQMAAPGYSRLSNGMTVMWGKVTGIAISGGESAQATITFPKGFPAMCVSCQVMIEAVDGDLTLGDRYNAVCKVNSTTNATFRARNVTSDKWGSRMDISWIAIGY